MDTLTYSIIMILVFSLGVFIFTYFETPRKTLDKSIRTINKGVKQGVKHISKIQVLNIRKAKIKLPLVLPGKKDKDDKDLHVYVHEY